MITSVGQSNDVQRFSAVNALRTSANITKPQELSRQIEEEEVRTPAPKGLLDRVDVNEIKEDIIPVSESENPAYDINFARYASPTKTQIKYSKVVWKTYALRDFLYSVELNCFCGSSIIILLPCQFCNCGYTVRYQLRFTHLLCLSSLIYLYAAVCTETAVYGYYNTVNEA